MKRIIISSILAASSLGASTAVAGLGTDCVTSGQSQPYSNAGNGRKINTSTTSTSTFICMGVSSGPFAARSVTVVDLSPSAVSCYLQRSNSSGQVTWSSPTVSSSGSSSTLQVLSFPSPGGSGDIYGITCTIPVDGGLGLRSGIVSYDVN
ncbi:MAG TPA: hypothetical protein VFZ53_17285 [Polyangiaceae bacterium]